MKPHGTPFSASRVNRVIASLLATTSSRAEVLDRWLEEVGGRVVRARPDIADELCRQLGRDPSTSTHLLDDLSIGEVAVCYEALLTRLDRQKRKDAGQFFTPDDAAAFMASRSMQFGPGVWMDPCCGVGNLAWHLANAQSDPGEFVRSSLVLIDQDGIALRSAIALIAADFVDDHDVEAVTFLASRAQRRDFLSAKPLPPHDFAIFNPPYARAPERSSFETGSCRDLFAYFTEKIAKGSKGYISVTPAAFLSAPKFSPLREVMNNASLGGDIYVFDNVPDTLFRGYKFGSNNTSRTNFVRAAITVSTSTLESWRVTPILRWQARDRDMMFRTCETLLTTRQIGPHDEWVKLDPQLVEIWRSLAQVEEQLSDLVSNEPTDFSLDIGLTPRYYISATYRTLDRSSKSTLYFESAELRERVALVMNSSVPYLWWRALDGGVTLPKRVLLSTPIPKFTGRPDLVKRVHESEKSNLVVKVNAGRPNENVKHPWELVSALNAAILGDSVGLDFLYRNNMFADQIGTDLQNRTL